MQNKKNDNSHKRIILQSYQRSNSNLHCHSIYQRFMEYSMHFRLLVSTVMAWTHIYIHTLLQIQAHHLPPLVTLYNSPGY